MCRLILRIINYIKSFAALINAHVSACLCVKVKVERTYSMRDVRITVKFTSKNVIEIQAQNTRTGEISINYVTLFEPVKGKYKGIVSDIPENESQVTMKEGEANEQDSNEE